MFSVDDPFCISSCLRKKYEGLKRNYHLQWIRLASADIECPSLTSIKWTQRDYIVCLRQSGGNISATKIHVIAPSISRYLEKPLSRYDDHNRASASFQRAFEMPVFFVSAPRFSCSESQPKSKTGARRPIRQQHGSIRTEHVRIRVLQLNDSNDTRKRAS